MRLTSSIFIQALIHRLFADGAAAVIEKKGDEHAGAIFIKVLKRDHTQMLLRPAPQSLLQENGKDRIFEIGMENAADTEINACLEREKSFDGDIWIIEIETSQPEFYLDLVLPDRL